MRTGRGVAAALTLALLIMPVLAQELPPAEISVEAPVEKETAVQVSAGEVAAAADADVAAPQYLEIYSSGYSRFEVGDDGHILVVYSGGVEFKYLGFTLRADDLRFDQATRTALVTGDVKLESVQFMLTSQRVELDGIAGRGSVNGHLVGQLLESGIRFEATRADLTFQPNAEEFESSQAQLTLSGNVSVFGPAGSELRTEQIAFDGATRRFSSAPFSLRASMRGAAGKPPVPLQVQGTALGGLVSAGGELAELNVLSLRAASPQGRLNAAQAVARPEDSSGAWRVEVSGEPVRFELAGAELPSFSAQPADPAKPPKPVGPVLMQASEGLVEIDGDGLKSAALTGGVALTAAGNRLDAVGVSIARRAAGYAVSVGGIRLGLDLVQLTGVQPVDLSELID